MSDHVKNESDMSDFEPVGNLSEFVSGCRLFVWFLAKTKKVQILFLISIL